MGLQQNVPCCFCCVEVKQSWPPWFCLPSPPFLSLAGRVSHQHATHHSCLYMCISVSKDCGMCYVYMCLYVNACMCIFHVRMCVCVRACRWVCNHMKKNAYGPVHVYCVLCTCIVYCVCVSRLCTVLVCVCAFVLCACMCVIYYRERERSVCIVWYVVWLLCCVQFL